jgi:hypothetical protein
MDQFLAAARLNPTSELAQKNLANSIDRHTDPRPDISRPVQIGLFFLGLVLPPVRLVMLVWWIVSLVVRKSRRQSLPPVMQMAYGLRKGARFSMAAGLCCLGVIGALLFGVLAPAVTKQRAATDLIVLYSLGGGCLVLALVTGYRLWRRWQARQTAA